MARPRKPWYWAERGGWYVTVRGRRRLLAAGKGARKEAMAEFHLLMAAEGAAGHEARAGQLTASDVFDLFLERVEREVEGGTKAASTYSGYHWRLADAAKGFGRVRASEVRPLHVTAWLDGHEWGPTMRHSAVTAVMAAFAWAHAQGHLRGNPLAGMAKPRPRVREAIPTEAEVARIVAAIRDRAFLDFVTALRETGCRPCEVRTLEGARVDLESGTWGVLDKIRGQTGERFRTVHLTPKMVELSRRLLAEHPEGVLFRNRAGGAWTRTNVVNRFLRLQRKLGLGPECCAYAFRHVYITDALERGVQPATVAELVGHRNLAMITKVYSKLKERTGHLREAVQQIRP